MSDDRIARTLQDLFSVDVPEGEPSEEQEEELSLEVTALETFSPAQEIEPSGVPETPGASTTEIAQGTVPEDGQQAEPPVSSANGDQEPEIAVAPARAPTPAAGVPEAQAQLEGDATGREGVSAVRAWLSIGIVYFLANTLFYLMLAAGYYGGWFAGSLATMEKLARMGNVSAVFALFGGVLVAAQWWLARKQQRVARSMWKQNLAWRQQQMIDETRCRELEEAHAILQVQVKRLELSAEVGQLASLGPSLHECARHVTTWFCERFAVSCAGLFLMDDGGAAVTLEAAAGHTDGMELAGQLRLDSDGCAMLQTCVTKGQPGIVRDMQLDQGRPGGSTGSDVRLLSGSRSAIMLPLIARGDVIGLIRLESVDPLMFPEQDAAFWQSLADQVAPQIASARVHQDLQARLRQMEALQKGKIREVWERFLLTRPRAVYEYKRPGVPPPAERLAPDLDRVAAEPRLVALDGQDVSSGPALMAPISLRDQVIGALGLEDAQDRPWTGDEIDIVSAVCEQIGLILDNARLFEEARAGASREHQVREITARMRESLDIDSVLKIAAQEIRQLLELHDIVITVSQVAGPLEVGVDAQGLASRSYCCDAQGVVSVTEGPGPDSLRDLAEQQAAIVVRGQTVGMIRARKPAAGDEWTEDEKALLGTLVDQLNVALENARLYEDVQRRAARDRLIGDLAASIGQTLDVEVVLRTAVQELREVLDLPEVTIRLVPPAVDDLSTPDRPLADAPSTGRR